MNKLYDILKEKGHDLSWYDKSKRRAIVSGDPVVLNDERCSILSIYLIDKVGKMWTTHQEGRAYMQVRQATVKPTRAFYICAHCKLRFNTYEAAANHL